MSKERPIVYPYIPNSAPDIKKEMMDAVGIREVDELYIDTPLPFLHAAGARWQIAAVHARAVTTREIGHECIEARSIADEVDPLGAHGRLHWGRNRAHHR